MVNLTRIYTRTGDDGTTALGDFSRTRKTDTRLAAYADVDEANAAIGVAIAGGNLDEDVRALLTRIQNDLFDVGADLCTPVIANPKIESLRIRQADIERLESACDSYNSQLTQLRSFVLPGGSIGSAYLHVARTVTRRAERGAWAAIEEHGEGVNRAAATYLNRLSDLLFILCRYANRTSGDVLWVPGASR